MDDIPSSEVSPIMVVHRAQELSTGTTAERFGVTMLSTAPGVGPQSGPGSPQCRAPLGHAPLLIRTIRSLTWSKIWRRSFMSDWILTTACMTVVWSRPPNSLAMAGYE